MNAENDWAAKRILRKDAVRLDLKYDLDLAKGEGVGGSRLGPSSGGSSSSSGACDIDSSRG